MKFVRKHITLSARKQGFHLITNEISREIPEIQNIETGFAHIFIQHTSAALTINENADPTVRRDLAAYFQRAVPEDTSLYEHTLEGPDDMTSHIKASLLGPSLTIPVTNGKFELGTWQGIYLCEYRKSGRRRKLVVTLMGE